MSSAFSPLGLSRTLCTVLGELGYTEPTPVQAESIPVLLEGGDLIGQSRTGSGKTAAFALPIIQRVRVESRVPQALVLCPTRELSAQVARVVRTLGRRHSGLAVLEIVGGQRARAQVDDLQRGVHIAVGTPGRVLDLLERGALDPRALTTVVLDEADRMLDMGFGPDVEAILGATPRTRQTVMFSATLPESILSLSNAYQRSAVRVHIDEPAETLSEIREHYLVVAPEDKFHALCWLLHAHPHKSALIFCNFKATVLELQRAFSRAGVSADRFDGDLEQFDRNQILARFRNGSVRLLLATDVAGRGIDVADLDLVINYELPPQPETYVHRIGRTGRAGKTGLALSLVMPRQEARLRVIEDVAGTRIEKLQPNAGFARSAEELMQSFARPPEMGTVLISGGRKDKVRPGDILGALTGAAGGLAGRDIGTIEIHDRLSYVAVTHRLTTHAVQQLNQGRIKGKRFRATLVGDSPPRRA